MGLTLKPVEDGGVCKGNRAADYHDQPSSNSEEEEVVLYVPAFCVVACSTGIQLIFIYSYFHSVSAAVLHACILRLITYTFP